MKELIFGKKKSDEVRAAEKGMLKNRKEKIFGLTMIFLKKC